MRRALPLLVLPLFLLAAACGRFSTDTTDSAPVSSATLPSTADSSEPADDPHADDQPANSDQEADDDPDPVADDEAAASTPTVPDQPALEPNAVIERVVDGDTIIVEISGSRERVRLLGIDTPESVAETRPDQCYGAESAAYLESVLPEGTEVTLIRDVEARDQYDRLLAYVVRTSDQLFVNLDLIERGFAGVLIYEPNSHYRDLFEAAEDAAFEAGTGLWGACGGPDVPLD